MSMGEMLDDMLSGMSLHDNGDDRLQENINIRQALAAKLLEGASAHSDPKIINLGLKALADSDKVTLTQQRNAQDKEVAENADSRVNDIYRMLVERNGKGCVNPDDIVKTPVRPLDERVAIPLESEEEINQEELIIGMDTSNAMDDGKPAEGK